MGGAKRGRREEASGTRLGDKKTGIGSQFVLSPLGRHTQKQHGLNLLSTDRELMLPYTSVEGKGARLRGGDRILHRDGLTPLRSLVHKNLTPQGTTTRRFKAEIPCRGKSVNGGNGTYHAGGKFHAEGNPLSHKGELIMPGRLTPPGTAHIRLVPLPKRRP